MKALGIMGLVATLGTIATVGVILGTGACKDEAPEYAGVGKYRFGKTTPKDIMDGRCQPTEIADGNRKATWCFGMPAFKIAGRATEVNLYFDGVEETGPLIEIQLSVRGCVEQDLETWMRANFGPPIETKPQRQYFKNSFLWAVALIPSEPGRCRVHLLAPTETSEIARLKAK